MLARGTMSDGARFFLRDNQSRSALAKNAKTVLDLLLSLGVD